MESGTASKIGRPRSERARRAVLDAAFALAASPEGSLTMEAIAKRAGVSKETLYRWWSSKAEVILEALVERGEREIPTPHSGNLARDLRSFMRATARALDGRTQRVLRALAAQAAADPIAAERIREGFLVRRRAALAAVLRPAVERGDLSANRAELALDLVFGSLWYRLVFGVGPLDRQWADSITQAIAARG